MRIILFKTLAAPVAIALLLLLLSLWPEALALTSEADESALSLFICWRVGFMNEFVLVPPLWCIFQAFLDIGKELINMVRVSVSESPRG